MKVKPIGKRVVIRNSNFKEKSVSGIILLEKKEKNMNIGRIVEISEELKESVFNVGDKILYSKSEANIFGENDEEFLLINLENILAIIQECEG